MRTTERLASVGRMAATVAHEINNPLEAVTNLVYLTKTCAIPKDAQGFLDAIEEDGIALPLYLDFVAVPFADGAGGLEAELLVLLVVDGAGVVPGCAVG